MIVDIHDRIKEWIKGVGFDGLALPVDKQPSIHGLDIPARMLTQHIKQRPGQKIFDIFSLIVTENPVMLIKAWMKASIYFFTPELPVGHLLSQFPHCRNGKPLSFPVLNSEKFKLPSKKMPSSHLHAMFQ
jgi:hypothetical protein